MDPVARSQTQQTDTSCATRISVRDDILERIEHLEYATVAEAQLERLKERLAGDVLDVIAEKLKAQETS